jgi:hypothetical protein
MPILPPSSTYSGGGSTDNLYLRAGRPAVLPSGSTLTSVVNLKAADGSTTAQLFVDGADSVAYQGAVALVPGANGTAGSTQGLGVAIRTIAGSNAGTAATSVDIGADAQGPNHLYIAGLQGTSEVYNPVYNPVIKGTQVAGIVGAIPANTGPGLFQYTPTVTGAYMLQVNFNIANTDQLPGDGIIEWTLNVGGGEVQYCSNTIKSTSISRAGDFNFVNGVAGTLAPPVDYSFSNMAILTAGQQVSFYLSAAFASAGGGLPWAIANYQVRLIQMC